MGSATRQIFIISPAWNEADGISKFLEAVEAGTDALLDSPGYGATVVIVDDGSTDGTIEALRAHSWRGSRSLKLQAVSLSRNFGHQAALQAGLEFAYRQSKSGDLFVLMDSDLQHPPELIPSIVKNLEGRIDHVQMLRLDDRSTGFLKRKTSAWFYRIFSFFSGIKIPQGGADFRGFSYRFVKSYLELRERGRFNRGLFCWLGYVTLEVPYEPRAREFGKTKYSLTKMIKFAIRGVTYFSSRPLYLCLFAQVGLSFLICGAYLFFEVSRFMAGHQFQVGWPTLVALVSFWGGSLSFGQLLIGIYMAHIFDEVKGRPIYVIREDFER
jgi:dolichol-phosphate mannosyltransferase